MKDFHRVLGRRKDWARVLIGAAVAGVFLGFLGPFGSYDLALGRRIFYCVAVAMIGSAALYPGTSLGLWLGERLGAPWWLSAPVSGAVLSGPIWLLFRGISPILWWGEPPTPGAEPAWLGFVQVLVIASPVALGLTGFRRWLNRAAPAPPPDEEEPRLLARLPAGLGRDILALQAEDHYVRVHTARGSALLLMRLADAIADLGGLEGMRVHRSWWVARDAIQSAGSSGRRLTLVLSNGSRVPVTREAAPQIRRAGWI